MRGSDTLEERVMRELDAREREGFCLNILVIKQKYLRVFKVHEYAVTKTLVWF